MNKVMVTGSSGVIGTRLCEKLLEQGFVVFGIDKENNKWSREVDRATSIVDLRDKDKTLSRLPKDADAIIHLAANARVYDLVKDPQLAMDNFITLFNVLEFARLNGVKKVFFSSSREVYGNKENDKHSEDEADLVDCESPYSASKTGGEALVRSYHKCFGIDFIIFRFSNVYGMYDESDRVIPVFIRKCSAGEDLQIFGSDKLLDFTFIDDAVRGMIMAIDRFAEAKNDVYNIAFGQGTSISELAELMIREFGSGNKTVMGDNRTGEVVRFVADIGKARKKLGYEPTIGIEEGVKRSIEWYRNNLYQ